MMIDYVRYSLFVLLLICVEVGLLENVYFERTYGSVTGVLGWRSSIFMVRVVLKE